MTKVVRSTPMYLRPYIDFSAQTPNASQTLWSVSASSVKFSSCLAQKFRCERSHRNFCAKHELNFTLLADTDHSVCEAFGVWAEKSMYGRKYMGVLRTTFVIDAEGRIEKIFTKVDTKNHYRQIADAYKQAE